ncbi:c-type cytochrome [Rhodanobacter denitrificans]|uniref:c-type cytochrome n=1 Tax=Rhodanobacter denitrificans TaxID=666685 RepID=UPI000260EEF9|nr:c-type cytochrome [Rhodanobacter denitrificans]EIM00244.1 cytochrome c family protein [Rhodanobacter denitrificans]UJJ52336.1 c-type cytochrome [Rhodanobacter denitrificans]UJM89348.1 c-type cytochrome [Rhodanobacter denitrificans]
MKQAIITVVILCVVAIAGVGAFVGSGVYNIGADAHHTKPVYALMQALRQRSIAHHAKDIVVPKLDDPPLILKGAGQYAAMCTGCHLAPGMAENEMRPGLYPKPPELAKFRPDPRAAFWVIKHGIKMSAMPAWGASHDDATIWSMVAFLQKLPGMTPAQYKDMVAKAPPDEDMHSHGDADEDAHGGGTMAGMDMGEDGGHSHAASAQGDHGHATPASSAAAAPLSLAGMQPKAAPAAEAAAQAFHAALQRGDRAAVLALLAPDASISEGGRTESRDEYAGGHLGEDIAFLKTARITPVSLGSMPMGDTAMVGSESDLQATIKGKPAMLRSREMLNLRKDGDSWKIVSVRWETAPVPAE